jgi:nucleotide-binding universal stress UspA family protein
MNQKSILVCIFPDLKPNILDRYVLNSVSFANQFKADIQFLTPPDTQKNLDDALKKIPSGPLQKVKTLAHLRASGGTEDQPTCDVGKAVKFYSCDLVIIPSPSKTRSPSKTEIREELSDQAIGPVLILSAQIDLTKTPIQSLFVPMRGEIRMSSSLTLALRLASQMNIPVDLLHVIDQRSRTESPMETTGDQPHHEYRQLLDKILAESCPFSSTQDRSHVRTLYDVQGVPSVEILKAAQDNLSRALIVEWQGSLIQGKAETLKKILNQIEVPVFLVRSEPDQVSVLKIGPENRVA